MKLRLINIAAFMCLCLPGAFAGSLLGYQANVVDQEGLPVCSKNVEFSISIHQDNADGDVVYAEKLTTETSPAGIAYFNIGNGGGQTSIEDLNWGASTYFIEVVYDYGQGAKSLGSTQIVSVPHAVYADSAASLVLTSPSGKEFKVTINDNGEITASPLN